MSQLFSKKFVCNNIFYFIYNVILVYYANNMKNVKNTCLNIIISNKNIASSYKDISIW